MTVNQDSFGFSAWYTALDSRESLASPTAIQLIVSDELWRLYQRNVVVSVFNTFAPLAVVHLPLMFKPLQGIAAGL